MAWCTVGHQIPHVVWGFWLGNIHNVGKAWHILYNLHYPSVCTPAGSRTTRAELFVPG